MFLFDVGGVLLIWPKNDPIFKFIAKRYMVPVSKMREEMNRLLPEFEAGNMDSRAFIERSLRPFGRKLKTSDDPARLLTFPFARGAKLRKGVVRIILKLRSRGFRVDGFSNTNYVHAKFMQDRNWVSPHIFDHFYASCDIGDIKPNVSAFKKVLNKAGVSPKDVVFIDNTEVNVLGAKRAGLSDCIKYTSIIELDRNIQCVLSRLGQI